MPRKYLCEMMPQFRYTIFVLCAAVLWGTTGTSQALAPHAASPPVIGALRLGVGGLCLLGYALALRKPAQPGGERFAGPRAWPLGALLGAVICMAAYQLLFFSGVARTGVAVGTIVGIGSAPMMGGALGYWFAGERPGRAWLAATLLAICGAGLLASSGQEMQIDLLGLALAAAAGAAYAGFTLFNKRLLEDRRPATVQAVVFVLAGLLLSPILLTADLGWVTEPAGAWVTLHLGLVTVGVAYTLFALGLRGVPVSTAVTLTLAEPMTAGILGVIVLGERLTLQAGLGILLIFSGLAVLALGER